MTRYLFNWKQVIVLTAVFVGVVVFLQRSLRYVCSEWLSFDCPYYWPVSIFSLRIPGPVDLIIAAVVVAAAYMAVRVLEARRYPLPLIATFGAALILGLTLIHGVDVGLYAPIAGDMRSGTLIPYSLDGQEYFHDARLIADPIDFFRRYNEIQPTLHAHGHTHPPGALLLFYGLYSMLVDPAVMAIAIMLLASLMTLFFFYRIMRTEVSEETARYMSFLLLLLPVVQIYYLATLDTLVTALLTGVIYCFCFSKGRWALAGATVMLIVGFLLTHVCLFILPVLVGYDLLARRSLRRSAIVIGGWLACNILFYFAGYDALQSLRTASLYENPKGFMLFVNPTNYFFTRLEDVAEILFFLGPFLLILFVRGIRSIGLRPLDALTVLACLTLLAMYLSGAWRTGETARACAWIYPYLLYPVGRYLEESGLTYSKRLQLAALVFLQAVGMQIFGNYHW